MARINLSVSFDPSVHCSLVPVIVAGPHVLMTHEKHNTPSVLETELRSKGKFLGRIVRILNFWCGSTVQCSCIGLFTCYKFWTIVSQFFLGILKRAIGPLCEVVFATTEICCGFSTVIVRPGDNCGNIHVQFSPAYRKSKKNWKAKLLPELLVVLTRRV